ncbi:MAG: methyl-accepting chemotaxis protein [Hydrogenovibrio sp.]|nr:methyl-accepting chemotaxis protein [Hydrogenovibrio sp.]
MRDNSPVTQQEYVIPEGQVLVSETDLHGNIVFANNEFIEVSGYSWPELDHQPHNLIRHPDVPPEAFADLWKTLKSGESWHQYVKNRRKNGDHYWVEANIAPICENGQVVGYKSVRNPIKRELIPQVESVYRKLRSGEVILKGGSVISARSQAFQKWNPLPKKHIMAKILVPLVLMALLWSVILQVYLQTVADDMYHSAVNERQQLLVNNLGSKLETQANIALTNAVGLAGNSALIFGLKDNQPTVIWQILQVNHEQYIKRSHLKNIGIAVFDQNLKKVSNSGVNISVDKMPKEITTETVVQKEGSFIRAQVPVLYGNQTIGLVVFSLPMTDILKQEQSAHHDYAVFKVNGDDWQAEKGFENSSINNLLPGLNKTKLEAGQYQVVDNHLFVSAPLVHDGKTVGIQVISEPTTILQKVLSDSYFMIYVAQTAMSGGFILLLIQVFWRMRVLVMRPMKQFTNRLKIASEEGSLSVRADAVADDEIGTMAKSFNHYVNSVQHMMIGVADMIAALSKGNLSYRLRADAKGDLDILKRQVNGSVDNIQEVIQEIEKAIHSLKEARYDFRVSGRYDGEFNEMVHGLQEAMITTEKAIDGINGTMEAIANGDFSSRLTIQLKGELELLKNNINRSLNQLETGINDTVDVVVAQSNGDLTQRISGDYKGKLAEMQTAVNRSLDKVGNVVHDLTVSSHTVNSASDQIAFGSSELSERMQEQTMTLQQTVASMELITKTVKENAEGARDASTLASNAKDQAHQGASVIEETMNSMRALSESSQKIADIIGLIDSIAFQTNLLALNAAVEAARAGEQGRGFAVVAGEVRTLAGKSSEAAKDIRQLIENSVSQVSESESLVQKSEKEFNSIQEIILKVDRYVSDIAKVSVQQSESVQQINGAIEELNQMTQQNAASVVEVATSAETLKAEAQQMESHVHFFEIEDEDESIQALPEKKIS